METSDPDATSPQQGETTPPASAHSSTSVMVGRYRIIERIAEGGMGVVYKAEQRTPVVRIVALKVIKLGMDSAAVISRFNAERQALAMMDHPNIAKVFDAGTTDVGGPYFVMEYVPGEPITTYCDRHRLTTRERLELFGPVCEAVQHAHQKGIIHRDLKPSNILVTARDGKAVPKVIDFGVAKATARKLTEETLFTESGQLIGTPEYMSPEQAEMTGLDVDTRSDIYSLGVVLYELLTGTLPFAPKSLRLAGFAEIQRIIRNVDPPRPSTRFSSLSAEDAKAIAEKRQIAVDTLARELKRELEWIPLKAMQKDRTRRYRTATELLDDLTNYLDGRPLVAAPDSAGYRLKKLIRRNRGPVVAVLAVVAALLAGIMGTTIGLVGQARQRVEAVKQAAEADRQRQIAEAKRDEAESQRLRAEQQEAEAKRQGAIAATFSQFQIDMLSAADPDRMLGDKVTVVQTLLAAMKELDGGKLKDQPLVESKIRTALAGTLKGLGRYDEAEVNLRTALKLTRTSLPAGHHGIAAALGNAASVLELQGKFVEAEAMLRESLAILRPGSPPAFRELVQCLNGLGSVLRKASKLSESEPLLREALEIGRKSLPAGDAILATTLDEMAELMFAQHRLAEAEALYRESLELSVRTLPAGHPLIGNSLNNLASLLREQDKLAEAEPLFRESLEISRKTLPAAHPQLAIGLNNLAMVLKDLKRLDEAEPLFKEALAINRKVLSPMHPDIATMLNNLGLLLKSQNKFAEAEAVQREALDIYRHAMPAGHPRLATALMNLGGLLYGQKRFGESESLFREAVDICRKSLPPDHPHLQTGLLSLAGVLDAQDKYAEAEPIFREGLALYRKSRPPEDWRAASMSRVLGRILLKQGKLDEAERVLLAAADVLLTNEKASISAKRLAIESVINLWQARENTEQEKLWTEKLAAIDRDNPPGSSATQPSPSPSTKAVGPSTP